MMMPLTAMTIFLKTELVFADLRGPALGLIRHRHHRDTS